MSPVVVVVVVVVVVISPLFGARPSSSRRVRGTLRPPSAEARSLLR